MVRVIWACLTNIMQPGVAQTDVTMCMVWEEKIGDKQISRIKGQMEERGLNPWDWYIVPAGAFDCAFGRGLQWVNGVGAHKVCALPEVPLGNAKMLGELWFVGGEQAFATINWVPLDIGEGMVQKAIQEWMNPDSEEEGVWHTQGGGFMWARSRGDR